MSIRSMDMNASVSQLIQDPIAPKVSRLFCLTRKLKEEGPFHNH